MVYCWRDKAGQGMGAKNNISGSSGGQQWVDFPLRNKKLRYFLFV